MKHCQIVMGAAGAGKSSYCAAFQQHCLSTRRTVHIMNCDPAAEGLAYEPSIDIRELVSLDDVEETLDLGPNGGLVYCIEYLAKNLEWLEDAVGDFTEDYLLIDMPGQVELYTHYRHVNAMAATLVRQGYIVCSVYLVDSRFVVDTSTFISATLMAMACQINLELPHFTLLSKMDLIKRDGLVRGRDLESYLQPDPAFLMDNLHSDTSDRFKRLNSAMCELLGDYSLVRLYPYSNDDPELLAEVVLHIDMAIQYGEEAEPQDGHDEEGGHGADEYEGDDVMGGFDLVPSNLRDPHDF